MNIYIPVHDKSYYCNRIVYTTHIIYGLHGVIRLIIYKRYRLCGLICKSVCRVLYCAYMYKYVLSV